MSGRFLIKSKGSLQLVDSLDGYPRAKIVAENVPPSPHPESRWENGAWSEPPPPEPTLEERVAALESKAVNGG
jgi:hypothetical protein